MRLLILFLTIVLLGPAVAGTPDDLSGSKQPQWILASDAMEHRLTGRAGGPDPRFPGWNALMEATKRGDVGLVKKLVDNGIDVNERAILHDTALTLAVDVGHLDVVRLLLENGADPDLPGRRGHTALFLASQKGYKNIAELLLKKGADVRYIPERRLGRSAVEAATSNGHVEIIKLLIPHLDPKRDLSTAFVSAVGSGRNDIVRMFLGIGVPPDQASRYGATPLVKAVLNRNAEAVKLLLQHGADPNQRRQGDKDSLLMTAVGRGNTDIAESLMRAGANTAVLNSADETLMDVAKRRDNKAMVNLLTKYDAPAYTRKMGEFIYGGIPGLERYSGARNKDEFLEKILGKPIKRIPLGKKTPFQDPTIVHIQTKWVYDGLALIVAGHRGDPDHGKLVYVELTSPEYALMDGLRIGQNLQRFIDTIGKPIKRSEGEIMYRIRTVTSHEIWEDLVRVEFDQNEVVRAIYWGDKK